MSSGGYECHLTFKYDGTNAIELLTPFGWKFSKIDGDPVLGKELHCYWTAWNQSQGVMADEMERQINVSKEMSLPLVRAKIEHIIYDQRY